MDTKQFPETDEPQVSLLTVEEFQNHHFLIFFQARFLIQNIICHIQLNAGDKASAIFGDLDMDGNGEVDEEEFIR